MRVLGAGLLILAASSSAVAGVLKPRNFDTHDYYTLHLRSGESPETVARALGLEYEGTVGELSDHFYFSARRGSHNAEETLDTVRRLRRKRELLGKGLDGILWSRKQRLKPRMEKRIPPPPQPMPRQQPTQQNTALIAQREQLALDLKIGDPTFVEQWHLFNTVEIGHDLNIGPVWKQGITGHNATVAMVDDGLDMSSDDLKDNYFPEGSYDFNDHVPEPRPRLADDHHGTRCAGEVAAVKNDVCGVGIAWDSKVSGIRILSAPITDEDEAAAINYEMQKNHIYSCSWGPPDDGRSMDAPDLIIKKAIQNGVQNGRGGLGSIFVFASGNGAASEDNCNFDGYTNSIYSITVGAIDRKGLHPYYSEKCSAGLVVTYSSGSGDSIHTTDLGQNSCSAAHGGTSAAAPLGAGVFALALSIRPDLTWRDMQYLCVNTAVPVNEDTPDEWQTTFIGKKYSHTFAYGKLDASAFVEAAKTHELVKPQAWYTTPWQHVKHDIPQGDQGLTSTYEVTEQTLKDANLARLEHVTVTMNINHTRRGDLSVELISPEGVTSHLSATRRRDDLQAGYVDWTFMSVLHWGEPGIGKWTVIAKDTNVNEFNGTFTDWRMTLWGESIDPAKQALYPMPTSLDELDHDHDDETEEDQDPTHTEPANVGTTEVAVPTSAALPEQPTDHIDRPVNEKPDQDEPVSTTASRPDKTGDASDAESPLDTSIALPPLPDTSSASSATATPSESFFLPSIFPTFGVSPKTQIWIYGAIGTILIFCIALGTYIIVIRRRKRNAMANGDRADYGFEILRETDDADADAPGVQRGQRRGGELYDAFAGESDEEFFSDEVSEGYEDDEKGRMMTEGEEGIEMREK